MSQTLTSHLSSQSQQPRRSPRRADRDGLKGGEQGVREGSVLGLAAVILPRPPWQSCSREQQAAHLLWKLREVGGGEGAAPHRPAINHSYVAKGQGVGRGQGAVSAAHTGQGKEARVRCGCKSSPKCFQGKANQGAVTEHTRPQRSHSRLCKHIYTHRNKNTPGHVLHTEACMQRCHTHTWIHKDTCVHQMCCYVCMCSHTHTHTQVHSDLVTQRTT